MALLIKAEELKGLITIPEAIAAVRNGFRDQGEKPAYSAPRIRIQHEDRRVSVHPGGCHRLQVAGVFIHVERFTFHGGAQQYEKAGKRVYVAYDSETAELKTIIVGSLPLFDEPRRTGSGPRRRSPARSAPTSWRGRTVVCWRYTAPAGRRAAISSPCARFALRSRKCACIAAAPRTARPSSRACSRRCAPGSSRSRTRRPPPAAPI